MNEIPPEIVEEFANSLDDEAESWIDAAERI